jgi:hypothetical protein
VISFATFKPDMIQGRLGDISTDLGFHLTCTIIFKVTGNLAEADVDL